MATPFVRLQEDLTFVYGPDIAASLLPQIEARLFAFRDRNPGLMAKGSSNRERFSQRDALLITYGDQVQEPGKPPLQSLGELLIEQMGGVLTGVHILPFYPWTSDDGFSVQDYTAVDPALGSWADVVKLSQSFKIMFDAVINHISAASDWFQGFLADQAPYKDYFITVDPSHGSLPSGAAPGLAPADRSGDRPRPRACVDHLQPGPNRSELCQS